MKAAAKDMNEVVGFEKPIPVNVSKDKLKGLLVKSWNEVVDPKTDGALTDDTIILMDELGCDISAWIDGEESEEEEESSEETEDEEDAEDDDENDEESDSEDDDEEEGTDDEEEDEEEDKPAKKAPPKKKSPPKKKGPQLFRSLFLIDAITKKYQDLDTVAEKGDDLYVEAGGKSNLRQAAGIIRQIKKELVHTGFAVVNDDGQIKLA
jgi:hypothetical protein